MLRSFAVAAAALGASGCLTVGALQPASTLGRGNIVGGVEGNLMSVVQVGNVCCGGAVPTVNGFVRFGVADWFDLGVRAGGTALEAQTKFMFTNPESVLAISLAPSVRGYWIPSGMAMGGGATPSLGTFSVPVPLLVGIKLGNHELTFGGRVVVEAHFQRDAYANAPVLSTAEVQLGLSAGIAIRLSDSFILMPELAMQVPVWAGNPSVAPYPPGLMQITAGAGCIFGKMKPRATQPLPEQLPAEDFVSPPAPAPAPTESPLPPDVAPPPPPPP